ncbi:hypothetical protein [Haloarcula salina]|uniref:Uncharacterized protein n=1 Tax=Haloarcula salina TaxID=1429914 RepID=A0AA41G274_9EURY|nr:hypothetical protein [Haloarcula salina]MBV0902144.1 hypothetical protein [Haloarcula salina]
MATALHPSKTLLVVLAIGLLCGTVPLFVGTPQQDDCRYQATAFDPETEANVLAHRSDDVTNLSYYDDTNRTRRVIRRAASGESVTFPTNDSELASLTNENDHAVYRGRYYHLNVTERDETATLRLEPRSADAFVSDIAVDYESVRPAVQRVVDRGNGTISTANASAPVSSGGVPSVVEKDGTYYVVEPTNELAVVVRFLLGMAWLMVGSTLMWLAGGYLGAGLGVYGVQVARGRRRALTARSVAVVVALVAVASGAGAAAWQVTAAGASPGDAERLLLSALMAVPSAVALALLLGVGVALRRRSSDTELLTAGVLVVAAVAVGAAVDAAMTGSAFLFVSTAVIDTVTTTVFGLPLAALGYVHADADSVGSA